MEGKIKSIEKKMYNGNHDKWDSPNGTMYKYNVIIETSNGDISGTAMSKSNTGTPYGAGDLVTFESSTGKNGNNLKIKKADNPAGSGANGKSYGANMDHVARQAAVNLSIELCGIFSTKVDIRVLKGIVPVFHQYLKKNAEREEIYARIAALGMVIKFKESETLNESVAYIKSPAQFVEAAEQFEQFILNEKELPDTL